MSSQPSDHSVWRITTDNKNSINVGPHLNPAAQPFANMPPHSLQQQLSQPQQQHHPRDPLSQPSQQLSSQHIIRSPSSSLGNPTYPPASRKRQYRFSVRADIDLLKLVVQQNPYGAPHGGRLQKWQAIADTLRDSGIDIDFRRARDRTALLLDQWREQDLSHLRRSGSGNHEDQAQKEQLLDQICNIEQAAKPRENVPEWRSRDSGRLRNLQPSMPPPMPNLSDNTSDQGALNVIASADPHSRSSKFAPFSAGPSHQGHLPLLVQNHDTAMPQSRADSDFQGNPFASNANQPPEKLMKNNQGKRLSPRFSKPLFVSPSSPPNPISLPIQSTERRSPQRMELGSYRTDLPSFRPNQQYRSSSNNASVMGSAPLDVNAVHAVPSSPRIGEGQNIQLDPLPSSFCRQISEGEMAQLRSHITKLARIIEEEVTMSKKRIELEDRRLSWERERENKRLQLEKERIEKEYEDRKEEREARSRREELDREERERMLKFVLRGREPTLSDRDNPD